MSDQQFDEIKQLIQAVLAGQQHLSAKIDGLDKAIHDTKTDLVNKIDAVEKRLTEKLDTIEEHVGQLDERLTETEKVKNIFRPEVFKA